MCLYLPPVSVSACVSVYPFRSLSPSPSHVHRKSCSRTTRPHGGTLTPIWEDIAGKGVLRGASEASYSGTASSIRMPLGNTHGSMGPSERGAGHSRRHHMVIWLGEGRRRWARFRVRQWSSEIKKNMSKRKACAGMPQAVCYRVSRTPLGSGR